MIPRRALVGTPLAVLAAAGLAGSMAACGAGSSGSAAGSSSAERSPSSSSAAAPTDAAGLGALMKKGAAALTTAHLGMTIDAAGQTITADGDERLSGGKLTAMDLSEEVGPAGTIRLVIVDGKTYAKLPRSMATSGKPWVLVTTGSTNPVVAQLASSLRSVQQSASLDQFRSFAEAASNVAPHGPEQVDGVPADHYSLSVDVTKMPELTGKDQLIAAGLTSLPVDLWVDGKGRPVKVTEQLTVEGQTVSTLVTLGKFDEPVTITAPPADQVETG